MIIIENLDVQYTAKVEVIKALDLKLPFNQIHGIVGLNGAGKTTLLNALYGLIKPSGGNITMHGLPLNKKNISYLQTENFFYANITGKEFLNIFMNPSFDVAQWNELFKLPLNNIIETYSTGMKKKLALLAVLKQDKPVMILDEPFNGLDLESARVLRSMLLNLKNHKTIIVTSHIIETLTNLCDDIFYLEDGKIKFSRCKEEFMLFEKELYQSIEIKNQDLIAKLLMTSTPNSFS